MTIAMVWILGGRGGAYKSAMTRHLGPELTTLIWILILSLPLRSFLLLSPTIGFHHRVGAENHVLQHRAKFKLHPFQAGTPIYQLRGAFV